MAYHVFLLKEALKNSPKKMSPAIVLPKMAKLNCRVNFL